MSAVSPDSRQPAAFSPKVMLALAVVSLFSLSALTVLSAYAPDLRDGGDGGAHALSKSAVGYAGAVILLKGIGDPVVVSRARAGAGVGRDALLVLTPSVFTQPAALARFHHDGPVLIVAPKWLAAADPRHPGWVLNGAAWPGDRLSMFADKGPFGPVRFARRKAPTVSSVKAVGQPFEKDIWTPLGPIDHLQTLSGPKLRPVLVDDQGHVILAALKDRPVYLLSDPDLLDNQGVANLANARAGAGVIDALRNEGGVAFDVSLNGFERGRSLLRLMLEPPLLGATLCAVLAGILAGLQGLVRFGPALRRGRAYALGQSGLVDSAAGLIRMSHKEAPFARAYAEQTQARVARAIGAPVSGEGRAERLAAAAAALNLDPDLRLQDLQLQAEEARTRSDLLAVGRRIYQWKLEITRERR